MSKRPRPDTAAAAARRARELAPWAGVAAVTLVLAALTAAPASSQPVRLLPVDEAANDPALLVYRMRLLRDVARKDTSALYSRLSPSIKSDFGGGDGVAAFKRTWKPGDADSPLWPLLVELLSGGGTLSSHGPGGPAFFEAPYWSGAWRDTGLDPFEYGAIIGENVNMRADPSMESDVIGRWSFRLVRFVEPSDASIWQHVEVDGISGYVHRDYVRSPIGYRIVLEKAGGRWFVRSLVAGD